MSEDSLYCNVCLSKNSLYFLIKDAFVLGEWNARILPGLLCAMIPSFLFDFSIALRYLAFKPVQIEMSSENDVAVSICEYVLLFDFSSAEICIDGSISGSGGKHLSQSRPFKDKAIQSSCFSTSMW